jgi:hypothetical protein
MERTSNSVVYNSIRKHREFPTHWPFPAPAWQDGRDGIGKCRIADGIAAGLCVVSWNGPDSDCTARSILYGNCTMTVWPAPPPLPPSLSQWEQPVLAIEVLFVPDES